LKCSFIMNITRDCTCNHLFFVITMLCNLNMHIEIYLCSWYPWKDADQGFQSGPVPGTFTRLRLCIVPAEITEPPKLAVVKTISITEDYTKLCLNIICNRSFFILKWGQLCSGPSFTQGWKDIGAKTYLFFWGVLSCCLTPSILFNFQYKRIKNYG
jgi:hypothetical protein